MTDSLRGEFIGRDVVIARSKNKQLVNLKGKIVDETKNTFKIIVNENLIDEKIKTVMKNGNFFMIGKMLVDGQRIVKRSEDRIKP